MRGWMYRCPCRQNRGCAEEDVLNYLRRWGLADEKRARGSLRFMSDPLWRAYTSTYVEGERLLRPWLESRPHVSPALHNNPPFVKV